MLDVYKSRTNLSHFTNTHVYIMVCHPIRPVPVTIVTAACPCYQMGAGDFVVPECNQDHLDEIAQAKAHHVIAHGVVDIEQGSVCSMCGDMVRRRCKSVLCEHLVCLACLEGDIRKALIRDDTIECNVCDAVEVMNQ